MADKAKQGRQRRIPVSQQEFFRQSEETAREQRASFSRGTGTSRDGRKSGVPKDVPVEDDDFAMQYGYRARTYDEDGPSFEHEKEQPQARAERGQGVPLWARPQKNNSRGVLIALLVVVALLLIKPLLIVAGVLLAVLGVTIGVALLVLLFVLALIAIIAGIVLLILRLTFGRTFQPRRFYDRRYWRRYQRGWRW
jgi:hypothetical protein